MVARVVTSTFQPGKLDEGVVSFRDIVVSGARTHPGFQGALMLTDPSTGKSMAITLWDTEAELDATATDFQRSVARMAQFLAGAPTRELYQVSVRE